MSETITRTVYVRYAADGFDPNTGEPLGVQDGSFFVKCAPEDTHEDAVFQTIATQFSKGPFPDGAHVVSFKVKRKDNQANRYEFSNTKSHSVSELAQNPALVRGNLVDANLGTDASTVTA